MGRGKRAAAAANVIDEDRQMESWNEKDCKIDVAQGPVEGGFMYNLAVHAKVAASPEQIYEILTDPESATIFRSIKACTNRKTLLEEGPLRQLEVCHRAIARFMFVSITFDTSLLVWEDAEKKTIQFKMARDGFMTQFDGLWTIKPFNQHSLDDLAHLRAGEPIVPKRRSWWDAGALLNTVLHHGHEASTPSSLVTLEQSLMPKAPAPPGLRHIIRGLCAKQVRDMIEDLRREVDRRHALAAGDTGKGLDKGAHGSNKSALIVPPAASASLALLWSHAAPLNITFQL